METLLSPSRRAMPEDASGTLLAALHRAIVEALGPEVETLTIERAVLGVFFTGVKLSNGAGGLCATPIKSVPEAVCCPSSAHAMPTPGKITGRPVQQILGDLYRPQDLRRTLAIATLNALAETLWRRDGPAAEIVPKADVLITTGTTLINGSLDGLLGMLKPGAQAAVIGPTATLFMPPYAQRGVTVVGGTRVHDPDTLLTLLAEGGSGYHFFEKTVERVTLRVSQGQ